MVLTTRSSIVVHSAVVRAVFELIEVAALDIENTAIGVVDGGIVDTLPTAVAGFPSSAIVIHVVAVVAAAVGAVPPLYPYSMPLLHSFLPSSSFSSWSSSSSFPTLISPLPPPLFLFLLSLLLSLCISPDSSR